jgi:hypothetical protein
MIEFSYPTRCRRYPAEGLVSARAGLAARHCLAQVSTIDGTGWATNGWTRPSSAPVGKAGL